MYEACRWGTYTVIDYRQYDDIISIHSQRTYSSEPESRPAIKCITTRMKSGR